MSETDPSLPVLAGELRLVLGQLRRRLRSEAPPGGLNATQINVLKHLEREQAATVSTLARLEGVRPQSMGATVAAMTELGLLAGVPDPSDGRKMLISTTPRCHELIQTIRQAREDWLLHAIQSKLLPAEQSQLASSVELLRRLLDQPVAQNKEQP